MILGIYGSGGFGREVKEIAESLRTWDQLIFIDDTVEADIYKGLKRMPFDIFRKKYSTDVAEIIIAQGEPEYKIKLYSRVKQARYRFANVIHSSAIISKSAKLGNGLIIKPGVVISTDAELGDNVSVQEYAIIAHDSVIGAHSQISANVMIAGHCKIGVGTYIGLNAPIRDEISIGSNSVIGMGAVVVSDIPDDVIVVGNPARIIKKKGESRVFRN